MAASCTSRAATGPLRVRTRNGHDPPRATRHLRLAVLTAARAERGPAISPACRLPRPGRSLLITRRHLACDCLRPISRVRRRECGRSHPFSTPRDSGHRVGDIRAVGLGGAALGLAGCVSLAGTVHRVDHRAENGVMGSAPFAQDGTAPRRPEKGGPAHARPAVTLARRAAAAARATPAAPAGPRRPACVDSNSPRRARQESLAPDRQLPEVPRSRTGADHQAARVGSRVDAWNA